MLKLLEIVNIAVIEIAAVQFDTGLNVLTGETGAGESIVVDAINAILGERTYRAVSYTHLDVYKRQQVYLRAFFFNSTTCGGFFHSFFNCWYFFRVALPPRMWRSALFSSSTALTAACSSCLLYTSRCV